MLDISFLLLNMCFPVFAGLVMILDRKEYTEKKLARRALTVIVISVCFLVLNITGGEKSSLLFSIGSELPVYFHVDALGKMLAVVVSVVWTATICFAGEYMKEEGDQKRFFGFFLVVYGVLMALCYAGNLVTFYLFYEMMTLLTVPLVLHTRTREAITAGIKYLLYSLCGAYLVLFGIYILNHYTTSLNFAAGGTLDMAAVSGHETLILIVACLMILGFGVKAGMFPMHGWLATAHPAAPAPASAVLSGVIVKMGVLGVVRVVYEIIGADFIQGTWVQMMWLTLALITVFMGSMLAYRENLLKKRLAYSTVSQISYILFGLALLQPEAMTGAMLHVVFHACIKSCLFLCVGAVIFQTGKTKADQMRGIGKEMPVTMICYTISSLALIGIPPASGFISKWYLAEGALDSGISVFYWLGPVVLLISALLTAGYLLPITMKGFLPGDTYDYAHLEKKEPVKTMVIPIAVLAGLSLLLGIFCGPLVQYVGQIAEVML